MLAKACACAVVGLEGALIEVEVEVDIGQGLPAFSMVWTKTLHRGEAARSLRSWTLFVSVRRSA